jgi:hypothetical protein
VEEFLADATPNYQAAGAHAWRGLLRLARADPEGAADDAHRVLDLVRTARDPKLVLTTLATAAVIFVSVGDDARAGQTLDDVLARYRELREIGFGIVWAHGSAWVARQLERPEDVLDALRHEASTTPWLTAGRAVAVGDFRGAADIFSGIGSPPHEAFYRLRAAEQLVTEGHRAQADEQLRAALAFYRSVNATRYVREGEALLAASA